MDQIRNVGRLGLVTLALVAVMLLPAGVFAANGEIGDIGDTDSITDVFVSGGRPAVNIDYLRDCAGGAITNCWIEVEFKSKCPEIWCGWVSHGFHQIPASGNARGDCLGSGNEDNEWRVAYRVGTIASAVTTIDWRGEVEATVQSNGSVQYKLIAEAQYNVTAKNGFTGGTKIETVTAFSDYAPIVVDIATSGGRVLVTC